LTERLIQTDQFLEQAFPEERARLVNLAARLTGSPDVAEDLAQEALMEAWRSRSKLVQPEGASR
jgi:DNA-directed RNA polymerase specialized sigma24 family protein